MHTKARSSYPSPDRKRHGCSLAANATILWHFFQSNATTVTCSVTWVARAMALRPFSWDSMAAADQGTRAALAGLQALIEVADGTTSRSKPKARN